MVTETDEVARALDEAAECWPAERHSRSRLLLRLIEEGHRALREERQRAIDERRSAIDETSGMLTGVYGKDYLERLREDWPA
ncbi:hypothetical protein [Gandjariella thermophila]|uniref:CopG family transcriptional regulator n=1 Tax=Gandjariella thermophila TaxID=1931992 RepID=A0A4D4JC64_9PSEU|nr:hypothetical protein [Gandjariella thermophila]GDY32600.1 hypothetical protein GTS_42330 [Gandjariella thermophila]